MTSVRSASAVWSMLAQYNQRKQLQHRLVVTSDWADYYFYGMCYIRKLSNSERKKSGYSGDENIAWYGVFHPDQKHPLAVSDVLQNLQCEGMSRGVRVCFLQ